MLRDWLEKLVQLCHLTKGEQKPIKTLSSFAVFVYLKEKNDGFTEMPCPLLLPFM